MTKSRHISIGDLKDAVGKAPDGTSVRDDAEAALEHSIHPPDTTPDASGRLRSKIILRVRLKITLPVRATAHHDKNLHCRRVSNIAPTAIPIPLISHELPSQVILVKNAVASGPVCCRMALENDRSNCSISSHSIQRLRNPHSEWQRGKSCRSQNKSHAARIKNSLGIEIFWDPTFVR